MTAKRVSRPPGRLLRCCAVGAVALLAPPGAGAFDTGHHVEMTETVLREDGFGAPAVQVVAVSNWLTDYFSVSPTSPERLKTGLGKLHFDNLYTSEDVARYWGWLMHNAREATGEAAQADDAISMLATMGLLFHAIQDFSSHSNWVELHRSPVSGPYRRDTWFSAGLPAEGGLFTGSYPPYPSPPPRGHAEHGDYDSGLNKDSHSRPLWAEAYVSAYCTTQDVLGALKTWADEANPAFWEKIKSVQFDDATQRKVDHDVTAARIISMSVKGKGAEGHWKGAESGSTRYLSGFAVEWASSPASAVVQQVKKRHVQDRLVFNLYTAEAPPEHSPIAGFDGDRTIVEIVITYVAEQRAGGRRIDRGRKADLFAVTTVGSQRYVDRVLRGEKRYTNPWATIHVADAGGTQIPIGIEVWDQDEILGRKDEQCDINPAAGNKEVAVTVRVGDDRLQGDVNGVYNNPQMSFEIGGAGSDELGVLIRGYVRTRKLASRQPGL